MSDSRSTVSRRRLTGILSRAAGRVTTLNGFQAAALLIAVAAAWPLMREAGLLNTTRGGGDSPFLLQRLHQLQSALADGHFPVRWMPDANYGYGFPFYNYYAPLSLYIAVLFRLIGFSYVRAIQLAQLAGFITAAAGMFALGRRWFKSKWSGLLAAVAFTLAPFHMVNVYVRGDSLAEFWAMAFYPLILLSVDDLVSRRQRADRKKPLALLALSYAGLILSHNISAMIFSPFLLLYIVARWWHQSRQDGIAADEPSEAGGQWSPTASLALAAAGLILAFSLAAHFFLPALVEKGLAQLDPSTQGHFYYANHFRGFDLVQPTFFFEYEPDGGSAFRTGLVQALLALAGTAMLLFGSRLWDRRELGDRLRRLRPYTAFVIITLLVTTFMITPLSDPLWAHLPLLPFTQFPWRFLSVQALAAALATAALGLLPGKRIVVPAVVILLLLANMGRLETAHLYLTDADVTPEKLAQYEWFTGNIGSTVSAEYLPKTVQPRAYTSLWLTTGDRDHVQPLSGTLRAYRLVSRKATRQSWQVDVAPAEGAAGATLSFPTMHWPGWSAEVDGQPVEVRPAPGSGLITLDVPPGEHEVTLRLERTPLRLGAELLSLAALLIVGWLIKPVRLPRRRREIGILLAFVLLIAVGLRVVPEKPLSADNLSWDFGQMGYLHHSPEGIPFDNGLVLTSYQYSHQEIMPGETLEIVLIWGGKLTTSPPEITLSLASPAANRFKLAPLVAVQTQPLQMGPMKFQLPVPDNAPAGLAAPRLTLSQGHAVMSANRLRGDLVLRPLRVGQTLVPAAADDPPFAVHAVNAVPRGMSSVELQLAWLIRQPLSQNFNITLRMIDANGTHLAQFDTQPGYGFSPTTGWPLGYWVNDWLTLELPEQLPDTLPYRLMVQLYDIESGEVALTRFLGQLTRQGDGLIFHFPEPKFKIPDGVTPLPATFEDDAGPIIQLHGYQMDQQERQLSLTLYWGAAAAGRLDYTRFVHLVSADSQQPPAVQNDGWPRGNSYPTGQWVAGEIVDDSLTLDLSGVPAGDYQLFTGLYRNLGDTFPRLEAVDENGSLLPFERVALPETIIVK